MTTMSYAQIGYQVSLLNTATGEPRANETVSCVIELKNSEGKVICSETKSATSNDFGVISLTVGNEKTFDNMDWSKLPLFVSVTIGGKLIGQSQVLTVPVAECAKTLPIPNLEGKTFNICKNRWLTFGADNHVTYKSSMLLGTGLYFQQGNIVLVYLNEQEYGMILYYKDGNLYLGTVAH